MKIKRVRLEDIELQVITGAITSGSFLKKARKILRPEHFKSAYGGTVLEWVYEYYDKYDKAPAQEIQRIFKDKKKRLNAERRKLVGIYLQKLSADYEKQSGYNVSYLYDKLIPFVRKRDIENLAGKLSRYAEDDRVDKASEELVNFQLVHKETSGIFNPLDAEHIETNFEVTRSGILELPDALGELIGPLDRGWLVSFTAPEKRGKTWWLIEMAFQAMSQKLNVLFVSLEMMEQEINYRMWKRLTGATEGKNAKVFVPVADCKLNQTGECEMPERESMVALLTVDMEDGTETRNKKVRGYVPCEYCRRKRKSNFNATFWYEKVRAKKYNKELVMAKAVDVEKRLGSNLRVRCFPAYTANTTDIKNTLSELDVNEGFTPDVLIIDYLDILAPEVGGYSERGNIDVTWKTAKGVAQEKKLLLMTVDQSSKLTYENDIRLYDTSEDKRKNAHLDVKVAMNKMPADDLPDDVDFLRFSVIAHRHRSFRAGKEVLVLQQKAIGQPLIDCLWYK